MLFETGLPTRYYIDRTDVDPCHLEPSNAESVCPYKGVTSGYWSAKFGEAVYEDIAWAYDYPLREVGPIAGTIAFYNENVDIPSTMSVYRSLTPISRSRFPRA